MSEEPKPIDNDPEVDAGPVKLHGQTAIRAAAIVLGVALIAWAAVSIASIRHGGKPVTIERKAQ